MLNYQKIYKEERRNVAYYQIIWCNLRLIIRKCRPTVDQLPNHLD